MKAETIAIGSELLLGQIVDTNTSFIAQVLAENGIELVRTTTVGDDPKQMGDAIREAIGRSPIVITTGGLGPTEDDLTRESVAEVTGCPLRFQPHLMEQIEAIFKRRGFRMAENNKKQAYIPEGSLAIENPKGTAPGFIVDGKRYVILSIPGVPSEMKFLMETTVIPFLRKQFNLQQQVLQYKVLRACGLGESGIGIQIGDLMKGSKNPSVGTLASTGDIKIRITAMAENPDEASRLISDMEREIRRRLGTLIYGENDETLQANLVRQMERHNLSLAVVEAFTGGVLSNKLTDTGSKAFIQGFVLSSENSQRNFLGVKPDPFRTLKKSPKVLAESLARQVQKDSRAGLGLSIVAQQEESQGGGEHRFKIALAITTTEGVEVEDHLLGGELSVLRERASIIGLDMLRKHLLKREGQK
jgi:nicotinamide-nucleotide amidase